MDALIKKLVADGYSIDYEFYSGGIGTTSLVHSRSRRRLVVNVWPELGLIQLEDRKHVLKTILL